MTEKSVREIIFNPRNMAATFFAGIELGLLVELLIRIFVKKVRVIFFGYAPILHGQGALLHLRWSRRYLRYGYLPNRLYRLCASSIVITSRMLTIPPGRTSKNAV